MLPERNEPDIPRVQLCVSVVERVHTSGRISGLHAYRAGKQRSPRADQCFSPGVMSNSCHAIGVIAVCACVGQNAIYVLLQYVAEALVEFASLTAQDTLFDLGCNDGKGYSGGAAMTSCLQSMKQHCALCAGRIVITAARLASLKAVGIEIDRKAAIKAQQTVNLGKFKSEVE